MVVFNLAATSQIVNDSEASMWFSGEGPVIIENCLNILRGSLSSVWPTYQIALCYMKRVVVSMSVLKIKWKGIYY